MARRASPWPLLLVLALAAFWIWRHHRRRPPAPSPAPSAAAAAVSREDLEGDARNADVKRLNRLKNRYTAPEPAQVDPRATLEALLAPGDDRERWSEDRGAELSGYVHDVKKGGVETVNRHAEDADHRDTHIELVPNPMAAGPLRRVVVEVTPRWREAMARRGLDWSTRGLRDRLLGRRVRVQGWLLFDAEHADEAEHTAPGRPRNWRATAWEVHPVTRIEVLER